MKNARQMLRKLVTEAEIGRVPSGAARRAGSSWMLGAALIAAATAAWPGCSSSTDSSVDSKAALFEGQVKMMQAEDEIGGSEILYELHTADGERLRLEFTQPPGLVPGARLRVNAGTLLASGAVAVSDFEVVSAASAAGDNAKLVNPTPKAVRRVAVLLTQGTTITAAQAKARIKGDADSVDAYYRASSYGIQGFDGAAFGPYPSAAAASCDYVTVAEDLQNAFVAAGNSLANYDHFVHVLPSSAACPWTGFGYIGTPNSPEKNTWYKNLLATQLFAHELGHNLGLFHTVQLDCGAVPLADGASCSFSNALHPFDPMGGRDGQFNAFHKGFLGWFGGCNAVTAQRSAIFNLLPLEVPCNGGQTLRVATGNAAGDHLYLEYRTNGAPFGAAVGKEGVYVNAAPTASFGDGSGFGTTVKALDMTPATPFPFDNGRLSLNAPYTAQNGVKITVLAQSAAGAQVRLEFPGGGSGNNVCLDGTNAPTASDGSVGLTQCSQPPICNGLPKWKRGNSYAEGKLVESLGARYACKQYPYSGWCGASASYEPGKGAAWSQAWNLVSSCSCVPMCTGRTCGSDGCGGSCGSCVGGGCSSAGQCVPGKQCTGVLPWTVTTAWFDYTTGARRTRSGNLYQCHTNTRCYLDPAGKQGSLGWTKIDVCAPN